MRMEWVRAALVAARNAVVGANLSSLRLIRRPRKLVGYHAEALFLLDAFAQKRDLPERHVLDRLPQPAPVSIRLSNHTDTLWFRAVTSYLADLVGLYLLCQALRPRTVFESWTLRSRRPCSTWSWPGTAPRPPGMPSAGPRWRARFARSREIQRPSTSRRGTGESTCSSSTGRTATTTCGRTRSGRSAACARGAPLPGTISGAAE